MGEAHRRLAAYLNVDETEVHRPQHRRTPGAGTSFLRILKAGDDRGYQSDHEANSGCWRRLAGDRANEPGVLTGLPSGVVVREWTIDRDSMLNPDDLDALLSDRTRLSSPFRTHPTSRHTSTQLRKSSHEHRAAGAWAVVDGVAAALHGLPDVAALGADVYLFSLYKTYGPHQGLMVIRTPLLEQLPNQGHFFNAGISRKKLTPAGPDHAQVAAAAGIADYLDSVYAHHFTEEVNAAERGRRIHDLFRSAEQARVAPLLDFLAGRPDVQIIGPTDPTQRMPTVSILPHNHPAPWLARQMAEHGLMVGSGHFYGARVLLGMGIPLDPGVADVVRTLHDSGTRLVA